MDRLVKDGRQDRGQRHHRARPTRSRTARTYDAVFIAVGAGLPVFMDVPGENLNGVYSANEYLTRVNLDGRLPERHRHADPPRPEVAVVGGGNVAMDAVRTADRLGAEPGHHRLPPRQERAAGARGGGPPRRGGRHPVRAEARRSKCSARTAGSGPRVRRMELGEPDESGRAGPPIPGSEFVIDCDMVVVAIGTAQQPAADPPRARSARSTNGATSSSTGTA